MNAMRYHVHRFAERAVGRSLRHHRDAIAMQRLGALSGPYVPWTLMAMRPSAVTTILNDVVINRRATIVECGGGVSTIYLARLLKALGVGHLHTIEDDAGWASQLRDLLSQDQLDRRVTVTEAPLAPCQLHGYEQPWYSEHALRAVPAEGIDLLLVDGPVAYGHGKRHARFPALPFFHSRLAPGCTVVLDDITRRGEQEVIDRWEHEFDLCFERRFIDGSIAIARRGDGFAVSP